MEKEDAACLNQYFSQDSIFRMSDDSGESSDDNASSDDISPEIPPRNTQQRNTVYTDTRNVKRNVDFSDEYVKRKYISRTTNDWKEPCDAHMVASADFIPKVPPRNLKQLNVKYPTYFQKQNATGLNNYFEKDSIFWISDDDEESGDNESCISNIPPMIPPRNAKNFCLSDDTNAVKENAANMNKYFEKGGIFWISDDDESGINNMCSSDIPPKIPPRNTDKLIFSNDNNVHEDATQLNSYFEKDSIFWISDCDEKYEDNKSSNDYIPPRVPPRISQRINQRTDDVIINTNATDFNRNFEEDNFARMSDENKKSLEGNDSSITMSSKIPPRNAFMPTEDKSIFLHTRRGSESVKADAMTILDVVPDVPVRKSSIEFKNDAFNIRMESENLLDEQISPREDTTLCLIPERNTSNVKNFLRKDDSFNFKETNKKSSDKNSLNVDNPPKIPPRNFSNMNMNFAEDFATRPRNNSVSLPRQNSSIGDLPIISVTRSTNDIFNVAATRRRRASLQDHYLVKNANSSSKENTLCMNKYFSENSIFRISIESEDCCEATGDSAGNLQFQSSKTLVGSALNRSMTNIRSNSKANLEKDLFESKPPMPSARNKFTQLLTAGLGALKRRRRPSPDYSSIKDTTSLLSERITSMHEKPNIIDTCPSSSNSKQSDDPFRISPVTNVKSDSGPHIRISYYSSFELDDHNIGGIHSTRDSAFCLFYKGGTKIDIVTHHGDVKSKKFTKIIDDLAVDQHGNIYFACAESKSIQRIDRHRDASTYIPMQAFGFPRALTYNSQFDELIVCLNDSSASLNDTAKSNKVARWKVERSTRRQDSFLPVKKDFKLVANTKCKDLKVLRCPVSICTNSTGDILISDSSTRSFVVFDGKMNFKYTVKGEEHFDKTSLLHHPIVCCEKISNRIFLLCNRSESPWTPNIVELDSDGKVLRKHCVEDIIGRDLDAADFDSNGRLLIASDNIVMQFEVRF